MKVFFTGALFLLAACQPMLSPTGPVVGGGEVGGGTDVGSAGDNPTIDHLAAWLVDSRRQVRTCIELAPDFGRTRDEVATELRHAFWTWEDYIRVHHVYGKQPPEHQLATRFTVDETCGADTDIKFYFGVDNEEIAKAKKQFMRPIAFIQPTARRRGFVWVAQSESWNLPGRLQAILLHELGHAYGNDHVPGTIMTASIVELLTSEWTDTQLDRVDHCRELAPCLGCTYSTPVDEAYFPAEWLGKIRALPKKPYFAWLHRDEQGAFTRLQLFAEGIERALTDVELRRIGDNREAAGGGSVFKVVEGNQVTQFVDTSAVRYLLGKDIGGAFVVEYNLATCGKNSRSVSPAIKMTFTSEKVPQSIGGFPSVYPW